MRGQIAFVAGKHYQALVLAEVPRVVYPLADTLEGLSACDVIYNDGDGGVFDVGGDEALEALLAGRVPEVQDDDLVLDVHLVRHEVDADSRLIVLIEGVVDEAVDDRGLTHGLVPQEDDLVFEFGHACCAFKRLVFCHYINRIFYYNC